MKELIRKFRYWIGEWQMSWDMTKMEASMTQQPKSNVFKFLLQGFGYFLMRVWWTRIYKCDHKGHWHDESYGNPDSGGDGGHCGRCGFSFWVQYY